MSSAPKRLHEEGNHSSPLKRPLEDSSIFSNHGKLVQSSGNDFRVPFETTQDGRLAKVPRTELREADKRAPLLHRMTSPSNYLDHSVAAESRLELRNLKDSKDIKIESREAKAELKESYGESRIDRQGGKVDKDARFDTRDGKEIRSDRGPHNDFKSDKKIEKDSHTVEYSHLNWKDSKEHYKGKRSFEPAAADGLDSWRLARLGPQNTNEIAKNPATVEERTSLEAHETVGENKVEMKGEEVYREKDRKKNKDFGERDKDRSDRQKGMQIDGANECKEFLREERETERLKRERNYSQKDKEHTDKDKYPNRGEPSNVNEKDKSHYDKELGDGSSRISVKETIALQPQQHRDDSCRAPDSDLKDRGRGMDTDTVDKNEKHDKCFDKESDDGCEDGSAVAEKNGQVYGNGLQQRKRMLRSRGTSQSPHREPLVRSRARDSERSQGQYEVSAVAYKPGVCMQELLKSWREFEASQDTKTDERFQNVPTLEIQIPAEYVTATNRQVRGAQLWGTDIYTHDSDLVAVLMHTGYCRPTASPLPAIHELRATVQVLPTQDCYASTLRNNVRSRAWGAGIGCSFRVERCYIVKKGGGTISLEPRLTHISAVEPTLAPVSVERTMTTRAAASNALRQQRFVREVTVQYNLCNEPWLKYSISIVADKGLKKPLYTATRLKKGEVLYLETHLNRYELCFSGEKAVSSVHSDQEKLQNHSSHVTNGDRSLTNRETVINVFRWSRCKRPLSQNSMRSIGIPLPNEHLEVLVENLDWEDVQWSQTGVWVAGKEYILARVHFLSQA